MVWQEFEEVQYWFIGKNFDKYCTSDLSKNFEKYSTGFIGKNFDKYCTSADFGKNFM